MYYVAAARINNQTDEDQL